MKPKRYTRVTTLNVRTSHEDWRLNELIHQMDSYNISIVAIQEHRRVHSDELLYKHMDNHLIVTASAWRNTAQAATGGVGIVLNSAAEKVLCDVNKVSDRIIVATFAGNPKTSIIVVYSPTNTRAHTEAVDEFYEQLRNTIDDIPPHNFLIIMGDWNAKLGPAHVKFAHDKRTNENGTCLLELANEKSLCITNTMFEKRIGKRWSFEDPKGKNYLLDYILVNSKWKNSIMNSECYSSFASIGSDHRIVTAKLRLSLRRKANPQQKERFNWKSLRCDPGIREQFSLELNNKFEELYDESSTISEQYEAFIKAQDHAAKTTLPTIPKSKLLSNAQHPSIIAARKRVDYLQKRFATSKSSITKRHLNKAKQDLQEEYKRIELENLNDQIANIEQDFLANNTANAWKTVNKITNRKAPALGRLKGNSPEERKQLWFDHFKKLLGTPDTSSPPQPISPLFGDVNIIDTEFTLSEIREAKKQISEGKAAGEDGIMPETLKRADVDETLLMFSNKLLIEKQAPEHFSTLNIVPVPKKGDLRLTGNYRGIALTSLVIKLINRMILIRIRRALEPLLRGNQAGFRPGKSTTSQILALRRILEGVQQKDLTAVLVFVDFCKAFDSINHATMFEILRAYGIPPNMLDAIKLTYNNLRARIKTTEGNTDYFRMFAGVMQGDTLAPYLFVIVLDYAMRKAITGREKEFGLTLQHRQSSRHPEQSICDLDFADDIVLLSNEIEQARKLLQSVQRECRGVGLELNAKKTEAMYLNTDVVLIDTIDGFRIKQAKTESGDQDFVYLGCYCSQNRDIATRKALAWQSLNKMSNVWKSDLSNKRKINLFRATTEMILLYGSQTWTLTKRDEARLDGCYTRMLRTVKNIHWKAKLPNKQLYGSLHRISDIIRSRRLKLAGHCFRDKSSPTHKLVTWIPRHGTTKPGRPLLNYVDTLMRDTGTETTAELESLMSDRDQWRLRNRLAFRNGVDIK